MDQIRLWVMCMQLDGVACPWKAHIYSFGAIESILLLELQVAEVARSTSNQLQLVDQL